MQKYTRTMACLAALALGLLLMSRWVAADPGPVVSAERRYRVTMTLTWTNTAAAPVGVDIVAPVPETLAPRQQVSQVRFQPAAPRMQRDGQGNLTAVFHFPRVAPHASVTCSITATVHTAALTQDFDSRRITRGGPGMAPYLGDGFLFSVRDPVVEAAAASAVAAAGAAHAGPYYQALAAYDFVRSFTFNEDESHRAVADVIRSRHAQCSDATLTLIALCRALKIPARYRGGVFFREDKDRSAATHAWAEIYLPPTGWTAVDPTLGRFNDKVRFQSWGDLDGHYLWLWRTTPDLIRARITGAQGAASRKAILSVGIRYAQLSGIPRGAFTAGRFGFRLPAYPGDAVRLAQMSAAGRLLLPTTVEGRQWYQQATDALAAGRNQDAQQIIERLLDKEPGCLGAHRLRAECAAAQGRLGPLMRTYANAAATPKAPPLMRYMLGISRLLAGRYAEAEQDLVQARRLGFDNFLVHHNLGLVYLQTRQASRAFAEMRAALAANSGAEHTYQNLITLLSYLEDWPGLITVADRAAAAAPNPFFWGERGWANLELNKPKEAIPFLKRAIAARPREGWFHALLGWAYLQQGNRAAGEAEIRQGISLGTDDGEFFKGLLKR